MRRSAKSRACHRQHNLAALRTLGGQAQSDFVADLNGRRPLIASPVAGDAWRFAIVPSALVGGWILSIAQASNVLSGISKSVSGGSEGIAYPYGPCVLFHVLAGTGQRG